MKWYFWVLIAILVVVLVVILPGFAIRLAFNIDKTNKMNMTEKQLLKLSDADLIMAIVVKMDRYGGSGTDKEKLNKMNSSERISYTVAWFDWEVQNGGLCQYFSNSSRYTAPYLSEALKSIGALHTEADFSAFVSKYHIDVNDLDRFHADSSEEYTDKTKLLPFDEFNSTFMVTYNMENLVTLNARFIRDHISDFVNK